MDKKTLALLLSLIGIALLLFGGIVAQFDLYGTWVGVLFGVFGLIVCIGTYLDAKSASEEDNQ